MIWWNKLPLVRLVIAKCRAHDWSRPCIYQFVWRLFSGPSNTKFSQEDVLQELSNSGRANRKKDIRMTRAMYVCSTSKRLAALPTKVLTLQPGDLARHCSPNKVKADEFTPRRLKSFNTDSGRSSVVYSAIQKIKSGQATQDQRTQKQHVFSHGCAVTLFKEATEK